MVLEIPFSEVEDEFGVRAGAEFRCCQYGVCREQYGGADADVQPLPVGTAAEQPEHEYAHNAG